MKVHYRMENLPNHPSPMKLKKVYVDMFKTTVLSSNSSKQEMQNLDNTRVLMCSFGKSFMEEGAWCQRAFLAMLFAKLRLVS